MVAKKKRTVKSKTTKAKATKAPARRRAALGRGIIDCMQLDAHGSKLCITSRCRETCSVEIRISCGGRISSTTCRWDGRQWVCDGDQGHITDNQ